MKKPNYYEIIQVETTTNQITLENKKIEDVKSHNGKGTYVRALVNGKWGFSSSTKNNKKEALKKATKAAKNNKKARKTELKEIQSLNKSIKQKIKQNPIDISPKTKIDLLKKAREKAQNEDIKTTRISYSDSKTKLFYKNSEDSQGEYEIYRTGATAKAVAKKGQEQQIARERVFGTKGYEIFEENNFLKKCQQMGKRAQSLLTAKKPPSGKFPAILDPELAGVFIHEAVGHAAEGDLVAMDNSVLKNKLGKKIASKKVSIRDDPSIKGLFGHYPFDWEGMQSKETKIIEDGVLKNYLNSKESSPKTGTSVTPNFRSQSFSNNPLVRMSNTYLKEGEQTKQELIEDINRGIYLKGSRGGQVSTAEGNFQFNAEEGYIIKNGEIKEQIKDVSLSGNTLNILKNIEALSRKKEFSPGHCGKGGQLIPVSEGAPHTKLKQVLIGGKQ